MIEGEHLDEPIVREVRGCPSCGFDHDQILFWEKADVFGAPTHPPLVGYCPEAGDSVSIVLDKEGREKTVAIK